MGKAWLGYLSSVLIFFAGILKIVGERPIVGAIFILLSIAGIIIKIFLQKGSGGKA